MSSPVFNAIPPTVAEPDASTTPPVDGGPMDDDAVTAAVGEMVQDCISFDQSDLAPDRAKATKYYKGEKFGDEEDGRSQVVLTEVRDAVMKALPSLFDVFFASEHVVEFRARGPQDQANADQMTDYVNYVITEDNNGFLTCLEAWKDALIRRRGVIKWWWEAPEQQTDTIEGATDNQLALLQQQGVQVKVLSQMPDGQGGALYTAEITQTTREGRAKIMAVPCEEFVHSRNARTLESALCIAHQTELRRSELLSMGIKGEDIDAWGGESSEIEMGVDAIARQPKNNQMPDRAPTKDSVKSLYIECYVYLDVDGDGHAEHRRICLLGNGYHVVHNEPWPDRPFAVYVPDPEPHTLVGNSYADFTMDAQNVKSHVMRYVLDGAARSLFPRTGIDESRVNLTDAANTENGAQIRVRGDPHTAMMDLTSPFIGQQIMPVLDYWDNIVEARTGQNRMSAGLDPDALQSTDKAAVMATIQAAQQRLKMLARIFAETGHKQLMRGLAKLLHRHQPQARMVQLRNQWVAVDPRSWDPDPEVTVRVGLGTGQVQERLTYLGSIASKQEQHLQTMGLSNPACGLPQLLNTYKKMLQLMGETNTTQYFNVLPLDWTPPPPQPPPPTPEQMLAQVEMEKIKADIAIKQAELALKERDQQTKALLSEKKMHLDAFLGAMQLELKAGQAVDKTMIDRIMAMQSTIQTVAEE